MNTLMGLCFLLGLSMLAEALPYSYSSLTSLTKKRSNEAHLTGRPRKVNLMFINGKDTKIVKVPHFGKLDLNCRAMGPTNPTIHWRKDDQRLYQNPSIDELTVNGEAVTRGNIDYASTQNTYIDHCVTEDAEYICVAETPLNKISRKFIVQVEPLPMGAVIPEECASYKNFLLERELENTSEQRRLIRSVEDSPSALPAERFPPQIYMWSTNVRAMEGSHFQVFCRVRGASPSTIVWSVRSLSGEFKVITPEVAIENGVQQLPNGDLLVRSMTNPADNGAFFFRCQSETMYGSAEKTVGISVIAPS